MVVPATLEGSHSDINCTVAMETRHTASDRFGDAISSEGTCRMAS